MVQFFVGVQFRCKHSSRSGTIVSTHTSTRIRGSIFYYSTSIKSFSLVFLLFTFISEQCRHRRISEQCRHRQCRRRRRRRRFHLSPFRYENSRLKSHYIPISRRNRYIIDLSRPCVSNSKEEKKTIVLLLDDDVRQEHYYLLDDT